MSFVTNGGDKWQTKRRSRIVGWSLILTTQERTINATIWQPSTPSGTGTISISAQRITRRVVHFVTIPPHRKGEKHMSYLHVFVDSHQFEEATTALLAGQEEYRLPRQTLRNQYGTFQYVAKLHSREGENGILVENEVKMYEDINDEWHLVTSTLEFVAFYPLSFITQHMPLLNRDQE